MDWDFGLESAEKPQKKCFLKVQELVSSKCLIVILLRLCSGFECCKRPEAHLDWEFLRRVGLRLWIESLK